MAGPARSRPNDVGQSSEAVMLDTARAAATPSYEVMGFPITLHQISVVGGPLLRSNDHPSLMMAGMPASPHSWPS